MAEIKVYDNCSYEAICSHYISLTVRYPSGAGTSTSRQMLAPEIVALHIRYGKEVPEHFKKYTEKTYYFNPELTVQLSDDVVINGQLRLMHKEDILTLFQSHGQPLPL